MYFIVTLTVLNQSENNLKVEKQFFNIAVPVKQSPYLLNHIAWIEQHVRLSLKSFFRIVKVRFYLNLK